ncbi:MAG TPA: hypothetical protein PKC96_05755 [Bacilli bacterium]|nr:hypothetical protein [Bacilli bacterium]
MTKKVKPIAAKKGDKMTKKRKPAIKIKSTAKSKTKSNISNFENKKNDITIEAAEGRKKANEQLKGWESYYKDLYPKNWKSKMLNEVVDPSISNSKTSSTAPTKSHLQTRIRAWLKSYNNAFKQYKKKLLLQKNERKK